VLCHLHRGGVERRTAFADGAQGHVHGLLDEMPFVDGGALNEDQAVLLRFSDASTAWTSAFELFLDPFAFGLEEGLKDRVGMRNLRRQPQAWLPSLVLLQETMTDWVSPSRGWRRDYFLRFKAAAIHSGA